MSVSGLFGHLFPERQLLYIPGQYTFAIFHSYTPFHFQKGCCERKSKCLIDEPESSQNLVVRCELCITAQKDVGNIQQHQIAEIFPFKSLGGCADFFFQPICELLIFLLKRN